MQIQRMIRSFTFLAISLCFNFQGYAQGVLPWPGVPPIEISIPRLSGPVHIPAPPVSTGIEGTGSYEEAARLDWRGRDFPRDERGDLISRQTPSSAARGSVKRINYPLWDSQNYPSNPGELDMSKWKCTKPDLGQDGYYEYEYTPGGAYQGERLRYWPKLRIWQHVRIHGGREQYHNGRYWDYLESFMQIP